MVTAAVACRGRELGAGTSEIGEPLHRSSRSRAHPPLEASYSNLRSGRWSFGWGASLLPGVQVRHHVVVSFERITIDPDKMGGLPCIRGLRIPVTTVLGQLGAGRTPEEVLADFPDLEPADILEAIRFAAAAVQERELPILSGS
jgi:uncharacterized protein (DUF433 family)